VRAAIKMPGILYQEILQDLRQAHPFAGERVGFALGRLGSLHGGDKLIVLSGYHSVPDDQYLADPTVGARIGPDALTWAMQAAYHGRPAREGIFHIHLHDHLGQAKMSRVDRFEIPRLMPGFQSVGREAPHGIVVLTQDHGSGWIWLPTMKTPVCADTINVIGAPLRIFEREN
jgi:hypothetical protein